MERLFDMDTMFATTELATAPPATKVGRPSTFTEELAGDPDNPVQVVTAVRVTYVRPGEPQPD
jgi:hypothetical protein